MAQALPGLAIPLDTPPMEAKLVAALPVGSGWQFEPKWDGFRCLAFRSGEAVELRSKSGKPLGRYFPEIAGALLELKEQRFVLDGELVLPVGSRLSFADLQLRLHPAPSRIERLSRETPALLVAFDCLQLGDEALADRPLGDRRARLEGFLRAAAGPRLALCPMTLERGAALEWIARSGVALDGVIAKQRDLPYRAGERAMLKVKQQRTADCVVGGYRRAARGTGVGSLLLGLYDADARLNYVGFTASFSDEARGKLAALIEPFVGPSPFDGNAPGGVSRWSKGGETEWVALRPELVAEVAYDQVTGQRFRHGTRFVRWRPDKAPAQCTMDQLAHELSPAALTM